MILTGTVLLNETYKQFILLWSYRFNFLTQTFMIGFLFVGISFFVSGGSPAPGRMAPALLGYLIWFTLRSLSARSARVSAKRRKPGLWSRCI